MDTVINTIKFKTPLGTMHAAATEEGLCMLEFNGGERMDNELNDLSLLLKAEIVEGDNHVLHETRTQIEEYFDKKRKEFTIPLITPGTEFQRLVWSKLLEIPFGQTRSYKQQSIAVGNLKAIRAVASANGANRIAIIVPCHRIIGDNGSLIGYAGGLPKKQWLLEHESGIGRLF
jgi:AraC family transcriptional regulator of adaptative response/methylated-DNA-[protein]-cysteine methyltransferase